MTYNSLTKQKKLVKVAMNLLNMEISTRLLLHQQSNYVGIKKQKSKNFIW